MDAKHTPGPWKATVGACYEQVEVEGGPLICFAAIREESKANARLIAAAPELLEALILMVRTHDEPAETLLQEAKEQQWLAKAHAAIAKATA